MTPWRDDLITGKIINSLRDGSRSLHDLRAAIGEKTFGNTLSDLESDGIIARHRVGKNIFYCLDLKTY